MFFILTTINLILYIACGFSFFKGKSGLGVIYLIIALLQSLFNLMYYHRRAEVRRFLSECIDCGPDILDCSHVNATKGTGSQHIGCGDCGDKHIGDHTNILDCHGFDCGGLDCHGFDCHGPDCGDCGDCSPDCS